MLSCSCNEWDGEGWYWMFDYPDEEWDTLKTKRRKRCCSCKELISIGAECIEFHRYRGPVSDIEERICGDEVTLASYYMCDKCSEIFLNLDALGYCFDITEKMTNVLKEYWELTEFTPKNLS